MSREATALAALLDVMRRLRDPIEGCPWDLQQDFASIAPYTIEEAYEVADAIDRRDRDGLRDELGDLLFQVVFHARLADERGWFGFAEIAEAIAAKLIRRHPHVFDGNGVREPREVATSWEQIKAEERARSGAPQLLAGVAVSLPALARAAKLGRRAAQSGFDWPDVVGVRSKVAEELLEADASIEACESSDRQAEELGDLLFAIANWSRHLGIDPEEALRGANRKFERRCAALEALALQRGDQLTQLTPDQFEVLWAAVKRAEHG